MTLVDADITTKTDNQGEFSFVRTSIHDLQAKLTNTKSFFDGSHVLMHCQNDEVFVDLFDVTGRKITSVIDGETLSGSFKINPSAYVHSEGTSVMIIRVQVGADLQSFKVIYNERSRSVKGLQEVSSSLAENYRKELSGSKMAVDEIVFEHDDYETKEIDINSYTGNLGTIFMEEKLTSPNAPSDLNASAESADQINLSWTDNSDNEDGFKIERSMNNTNNWSQITSVGSNSTSYQNTGLNSGTIYYYRVRAYNAAGNSSYSNTTSATTQMTLPADPSGFTASAISESQINLSWSDNSNNEEGFIIERSYDMGNFNI